MNASEDAMTKRDLWLDYLTERTGTYEYRTRRYSAVADRLELLGLADGDLVVDVGAGMCEFGRYLYRDRGWSGRYLPVDGAITGINLDTLVLAGFTADFFVAIEILEHLRAPIHVLADMLDHAEKGVVLTTPNTDKLGETFVREMDETHVSPIWQSWLTEDFNNIELEIAELSLFGIEEDTLLAWGVGGRRRAVA